MSRNKVLRFGISKAAPARRAGLFAATILLFVFASGAGSQEPRSKATRRNPFMPLVTPDGRILKAAVESNQGTLTLEGIIFDPRGLSYAIVNAAVVKTGDTILGFTVLRIEKEKVVFIRNNVTTELFLKKED